MGEIEKLFKNSDGVVAVCFCSQEVATKVAGALLVDGIVPAEQPDDVACQSLNLVPSRVWVVSRRVSRVVFAKTDMVVMGLTS